MKKKYLIGNIKMNMSKESFIPYFEELKVLAEETQNVVGVCVPTVYLGLAQEKLQGSKVKYGAQNIYFENSGTFTGETSVHMIKDFNPDYCLVGHSERRAMFGETIEWTNKKIKKLLEVGITPILCFGETYQERFEENVTFEIVKNQLEGALEGLSKEEVKKIIFAYEPVWAISKGYGSADVSATSAQAEEMTAYSRKLICENFNLNDDEIIVLYGGSMKPTNAKELLSQKNIDGGLIGGACLKTADFKGVFELVID